MLWRKIGEGNGIDVGHSIQEFHEGITILHEEIPPNPTLDADESVILVMLEDDTRYIEIISKALRYGIAIAGKFTPPEDLFIACFLSLLRSFQDFFDNLI